MTALCRDCGVAHEIAAMWTVINLDTNEYTYLCTPCHVAYERPGDWYPTEQSREEAP